MKKLFRHLVLIVVFLLAFITIVPVKSILQQLYPLDYQGIIYQQAMENDLDPFMVAAIIRVESSWRTNAVSHKGATGLMQIMPETAVWISEQLKVDFSPENLTDPEFNIRLGCWYLNYLKQQFPTSTAALAAYNGGLGNVKQWLQSQRWDGSLETANQIPFNETRSYVRKVIHTWNFYRKIYDYQWEIGEEL